MPTDDLITQQEAKDYIAGGLQGGAIDGLIGELITAASLMIKTACSGTLYIQQTLTEDYDMGIRPGQLGGARRVYLRHRPIVTATAITITDDDGSTISSSDYTIIADQGVLEHKCYWPAPSGRWTVVYKAGKYATIGAVEEHVKLACKIEVNRLLMRRMPGLASKSISGRGGGKSVSVTAPRNPTGLSDEAYNLIRGDIVQWV